MHRSLGQLRRKAGNVGRILGEWRISSLKSCEPLYEVRF
jgi:hypothetical protein